MQLTDLIARLNNLTDKGEVAVYYKALRQDALIWEGLNKINGDFSVLDSLTQQNQELNPGTLAVLVSDPNFEFDTLTRKKVTREALEKMMFGYENYLQSGNPVESVEKAGSLALALIEKRKTAPNWVSVFQDITSRMKFSEGEKFQQFWGTILVITINLIDAKEEFLRELTIFQQPEMSIDVLNHVVLCLPRSDDEKADLLRRYLYPFSPQVQVTALKKLQIIAGRELSSNVAGRILEKYPLVDAAKKSTRDHWRNPVSSMHFAFQCQAAADIAQMAGDHQLAVSYNEKVLEVFSALVKMSKVKRAGIVLGSDPASEIRKLFSQDELEDPEIQTELVYTSGDVEISPDHENFPVKIIQQAKKMSKAGNADLAREELKVNLTRLTDTDFEQILVNGPEQIQGWDPGDFLSMLIESGAYEEAGKLASLLLAQNPTNVKVNKAAALAAEERRDFRSMLANLETLAAIEPGSNEIKRKLAKAYLETGSADIAYNIYQDLTKDLDSAENVDLFNLGEIALRIDKPQEALNAAAVVLARNPENSQCLTLAGMAHHKIGQTETAIEELRKAIANSDGEPRPWIELGEIIWSVGDHSSALTTFKEGIAANPGNIDLQRIYAQKMMEESLVSEAYPYLLDLSNKHNDRDIDLLLVKAMKHLGNENIEEMLEKFIERYPDDYRFKGEYGLKLVWDDKIEKGVDLLRQVQEYLPVNTEWSLAFVEGLMRPDFHSLASEEKRNTADWLLCKELLDDILVREPQNLRAKLLKAEWLLKSSEFHTARELFDAIMDESQGGRELPLARLYAGVAQAAARTGNQEIALAALEQAIALEPDWHGLQRIKAEFHLLAGDKEAAAKHALSALELALEEPENYIWAINFMTGINETGHVGNLIANGIEKFPDHLGLRLIQAQNLLSTGADDAGQEIEQKILSLIGETEDADELVKAAVVFSSFDNLEQTTYCLEKAAGNESVDAKILLAGLFRIRKEHDKALEVLDTLKSTSGFIDLLRAEIEFDQTGQLSEDGNRFDARIELPPVSFVEAFIPGAWKELLESSKPGIVLQTRVVLANGQPADLMDSVCDWINADPDNLEARVYGIELSLACGAIEDYQRFLSYEGAGENSRFLNQFNLLRSEYLLDTGAYVQDEPLEPEFYEMMRVEDPQKIALIRVLAADGNLHEAETSLEMALSIFTDRMELPYVVRLGILRNLVKCAVSLNRWNEAVKLSTEAASIACRSDGLQLLKVKTLTSALEMSHRAEGLGVEVHHAADVLLNDPISLEKLVDVASENCREEIKRWVMRYKLAADPTRENIRELALLTPSAEDAAALMTGLRKIGQINIAMQVAKKFMEHPQILFELARCSKENDPAKALEVLEKSLVVFPNQPLALKLQSACLEQSGRTSEAVESLEEALSLWPNEYAWHEEAAELWQRLGNLEKPVEHLQLAALYTPVNSSVHQKLGYALLKTNKPEEALKHLLKAVEKQPDLHELWEAISEAHQLAGDLNLAMEAAERAVQVDPFAVKARLQAGKVRWTRGELEKALDQVNLAISLDPEDADNYVFMARLLVEQGDKNKALEMLDKAAQSKNATVQTMIEHASLLSDVKGPAAARDLIASFSEKYPENPELLKLLAEAEDQCGNLKKAELVAKKALEIHPGEAGLQMLLGKIQAKVGNLDQAVNYFSQAVALAPKLIEGYLNLSQTYLNQRDHVKARKVLEQGIERLPDEISLYLACASLLKEAKDYQGAEKMLRKASQLEPRNVNIHRQLGAVLALNLVHQSQEVSSQP